MPDNQIYYCDCEAGCTVRQRVSRATWDRHAADRARDSDCNTPYITVPGPDGDVEEPAPFRTRARRRRVSISSIAPSSPEDDSDPHSPDIRSASDDHQGDISPQPSFRDPASPRFSGHDSNLSRDEASVQSPQTPSSGPSRRSAETPDIPDGFDDAWLSNIPAVRTAQLFVHALENATLADGQLDREQLHRLLHPSQESVTLDDSHDGADRDLLLSLRLFLSHTESSREAYEESIAAVSKAFPQCEPLHYDAVKKKLEELTGVVTVYDDLCVRSCVAFTGPYADLEECPVCSEPRFIENTRKPQNRMSTVLLGPQIQALHREAQTAELLDYWAEQTDSLLKQLDLGQSIEEFYDICCGEDIMELVVENKLLPDDTVIMLSLDGAQLYRNKKSTFWISIYVILNFSPEEGRYKLQYVMPGFMVPGPNKPIVMESVMYTQLHHIAALNHCGGLPIWDAYRATERYIAKCEAQRRAAGAALYNSGVFTIFATADAEAMPLYNSLVGPSGKVSCRVLCPMPGRRILGLRGGHYYPMMAKPLDYDVPGCDHDDIDYYTPYSPISHARYMELLAEVSRPGLTKAQYQKLRLETGIAKPSILLGLRCSDERPMILGLPGMCPGDLMHEIMNIASIMLSLWRGTIDCLASDSQDSWDWMVLVGDVWLQHGADIAAWRAFFPSLFEKYPRNPAEKLSSGFKAIEYLNYIFVAGPAHLYRILPEPYWVNYCHLVAGMRIAYQKATTGEQIPPLSVLFGDFLHGFETLYIRGRTDRMHFMTQVVHNLWHMAPEIRRVGPAALSAQWTLERTIGNITREVKQPGNPFQNLVQRFTRRAYTNALKGLVPSLNQRRDIERIPKGSRELGHGYRLLPARERYAKLLRNDEEKAAILAYLRSLRGEHALSNEDIDSWSTSPRLQRWGGLGLPNGHETRCVWSHEANKRRDKRDSTNVKLDHGERQVQYGRTRYYFQIEITEDRTLTLAMIDLYTHTDAEDDVFFRSSSALKFSRLSRTFESLLVSHYTVISATVAAPPAPTSMGRDDQAELYVICEKMGTPALWLDLPDDDDDDFGEEPEVID